MVHIPQRAPILGNRKLGDLSQRKGPGNQSLNDGGRYDTNALRKLSEADSKKAVAKAQKMKMGKTVTGQPAEPVVLNPEKNIQAQSLS